MNALYPKNWRFLTFHCVKGSSLSAAVFAASRRPTVFQFTRRMETDKPKEPRVLRKQRIKEERSKRGALPGPNSVFLQVIGAGSRDTPPSLYVFSEYNRYLFNCGEGTQRLMQEHKLRPARLDNILMTRMSWGNVGGLAGMILTLKDTGVLECDLFGPPQLENYLTAIESFAHPLQGMKLSVRPYTAEPYTDLTMSIYQVPVFAQSQGHDTEPSPGSRSPDVNLQRRRRTTRCPASPKKDVFDHNSDQGNQGDEGTVTRDASLVVAYICKLHPKPGNILIQKAIALGLPVGKRDMGPLAAELKAGRSVVYEGKEIRSEQVCTPVDPGQVFIVVECPSEEFATAVCSNSQLRRYQTGESEAPAVCVVHMTPESVLNTESYKEWMERFPSSTQHLILNEQVSTNHHIWSHSRQAKLNMIHPEIFPRLPNYKPKEPPTALSIPTVRGECLLKFQIRPVMEWQRDAIPACNAEEFVKEASEVPDFLEEVDKYRRISSADAPEPPGQKHPEVVFLGTGSAVPMKTRNVSGTLVNISPNQSILLDCGEGTFGQLCRYYGDEVDVVLSKMSTVFISHLHADHHTGLLHLLYQRKRAMTTLGLPFHPIYLIAPRQIMYWLNKYHFNCEEIVSLFKLIPSLLLCEDAEPPDSRMMSFIEEVLNNNNLTTFQTCRVLHCKNSFACSFTHQSGWKLAFSGDTMPCREFVRIGKNATLLIHEATLEDGLEEEAVQKRHSTTSQAIGVGVQMNADFIMLNHFSQRYAKIPLFSEDFTDKVGISFDHMKICFEDFKSLPRLNPVLKTLFAADIEVMEDKREKKELRRNGSDLFSEQKTRTEDVVAHGSKRNPEEKETCDVEAKRQKSS